MKKYVRVMVRLYGNFVGIGILAVELEECD
jgi:hypothetical protein